MIRLQKMTLWLAALFALAGIACVMAFLLQQKTDGDLLHQATMATFFSTASLLLGVTFICARSSRQLRTSRLVIGAAELASRVSYVSVLEQFRYRHALLGERLKIDEPRLCTQTMKPCTAWSFCGSVPDESAAATNGNEDGLVADVAQKPVAATQPLKIIRRTGGKPVSCLGEAPDVDRPANDAS